MNIRKELISIITNGEVNNSSKDSMTLLELILKEKTLYDLKKHYCMEAYEYMKKELDFVTFYFRYNIHNSYDTVINLENYNKNKTRREITLTYNKDQFEISNEAVLTDKEKEIIYKDIDFYKELTMFGVENYHPRKELKTTSGRFYITLFNEQLILSSNDGKFNITYLYDAKEYNSKAIEVITNSLFTELLLYKNDSENLIKLLENIKIYNEDIPKNINELKIKRKILKK